MTHYTRKDAKASTPAVTFSQKWGDDPFTDMGHTQVPNALCKYAARLKLAPDECWLISLILTFKHSEANPFPSQDTLADMFGRSKDTVQRITRSLEIKGVLRLNRKRNDFGHYSHIEYDFTPLRAALNECYYQDHPDKRPRYSRAVALPHGCGPADGESPNKSQTARARGRTSAASHAAKQAVSRPHGCGPNQTPEEENKKDLKEACSPSVIDEEKRRRNVPYLSETELLYLARQVGFGVVLADMDRKIREREEEGGDTGNMYRIRDSVVAREKEGQGK